MPDGTLPDHIANRDARRSGSIDPPVPSSVMNSPRSPAGQPASLSQRLAQGIRVYSLNCPFPTCAGVAFGGRGDQAQSVFDACYALCQHLIDEHGAEAPTEEY